MTARHIAAAIVGAEIAFAGLFGAFGVLHTNAVAYADTAPLAACQYEDGNPDGQPCEWTDPDTGVRYWVDSANYH